MVKTKRLSLTLTEAQVDSIDYLIGQGMYLNRGQFISEYVRKGLREYGLLIDKETEE